MSQARFERRKQEREQKRKNATNFLKATGIGLNLVGLGWFYKHDTDEGWGIFALEGMPLWDFLNDTHKICEETFKQEMKAIENQEEGYQINLEDFQLDTMNDLKFYIDKFYKLCGFEDGKQPLAQKGFNWNSTDETMLLVRLICVQIYYLTQWGILEDDDFNGMSYQYSNDTVTTFI